MKRIQIRLNNTRQHTARRLLRLGWLPMILALAGTGCKQEARVAADTNPVGTYSLVSVDGNKVPCTIQHEGHGLAVKSGAFVINADGTCNSTVVFAPPSGRDVTNLTRATYSRQGSKLTMQREGAGTTTGTVESNTFSMNNEGMVFAYRK